MLNREHALATFNPRLHTDLPVVFLASYQPIKGPPKSTILAERQDQQLCGSTRIKHC